MQRFVRQILFLAALMGLFAVVSACGDDDGDADQGSTPQVVTEDTVEVSGEFPVTLERSDGRSLTIEAPPQRIVSLSAGHTEILFAIGAGDQVVAVDTFSDYPAEAEAIDVRLDYSAPSVEEVVNLDPDLVIMDQQSEALEALENLDVPVFLDQVPSIEGVFESIEELGAATGRVDEAEELVGSLRARMDAVLERVEEVEEGPRIYHELDESLFSISPESFLGDLYEKLKAQNIVRADEGAFPQLSQEAIIERNPEVILLADAEFGQTPEVVAQRPGWDVIDAVENDRLFALDPNVFSRPGPRIVDALEELAGMLYPDLFGASAGY